jgi:hypothetical protein
VIATVELPSISLTILGWTPRPRTRVAAEWRAGEGHRGDVRGRASRRQRFHVLRTVLRNQAARVYRDLHGATFVSYEAIEEARAAHTPSRD